MKLHCKFDDFGCSVSDAPFSSPVCKNDVTGPKLVSNV